MSAHTPGPWRVFGGGGFFIDRSEPCIDGCDLCDGKGGTHHPVESVGQALTEANAHLIAAAPDLLEALRGLNRVTGFDVPTGIAEVDAVLLQARAAIAKAEGSQP